MLGTHADILSVKTAFAIAKLIGVHPVADIEAPYARPLCRNNSCAIGARYDRESHSSWGFPQSRPNICVPHANAGRAQCDENLAGVRLGHREFVPRERLRRAKAINRRRLHGRWKLWSS